MSDRVNRVLDKAKQKIQSRSDIGKAKLKESGKRFVRNTFKETKKVVRRRK